jgi:hypothetical protein
MKKQEFILASKWCVKNSEKNNKVISEWFTDKLGRKPLDKDKSSYYHYPQEDNACTDSVVKEGYQKISYHEFCKYVLKSFDSNWCIKQSCEKACDYFNEKFGVTYFNINGKYPYLVNNQECSGSTFNDDIPEGYREISEQEFIENVLNKEKTMKKQTLTRKQLIELRKQFSRSTWKGEIDKILKINILNLTEDFNIPDSSITLLKESGSQEQKNAVKALGFIISQPIDYDKLECGSKVMIKYTTKHIDGIDSIDFLNPVDIILFKSPYIMYNGRFIKSLGYNSNITFHQNGKFCCFSSDTEIDYITEVISY